MYMWIHLDNNAGKHQSNPWFTHFQTFVGSWLIANWTCLYDPFKPRKIK